MKNRRGIQVLKVNELTKIYLGAQGENNAQTIKIDIHEWLVSYPNGRVTIWHKRNGDEVPYPTGAVMNAEEETLSWSPSRADTYVAGEGEAEIRLTDGDVVKKTRKVVTGVSPAVTGGGQPLGSGWQDYIDAVERAAQVAIIKDGKIRFRIDENGHLILGYTSDVPIEEE